MVLENQADVTARLGPEGKVEWITPSIYDLLGRRAPEVVGMNIIDFVHPLDSPGLDDIITRVLAGNVERFEIRLRTLTGEIKWVAATAKPLVDVERQTTGSLVNVSDVTARHEALSQLTRSEERCRLALECAPIGIALVDLERRFVVVNSAMCDMVGRSASWLVEHRIDDVIDPADDDLDLRMRAESLAGRVVHSSRPIRLRRPDRSLVPVLHSLALLRGEDPVPNGFVSTFVNITN
jgi:PAS domain S-box-containing protein